MSAYSVDHIRVKLMEDELMRRPNAKGVCKKQDTKAPGLFHSQPISHNTFPSLSIVANILLLVILPCHMRSNLDECHVTT
ncbi:hypothetical protein WALSEDRAFT_32032 [Wallemia mellicola CBS 633.66]|uniref:Uncharacterized protein n=1 Tax=Wallemia mellicola (strain ATCC MYA-4683 / CBS 633.66) TaxID=671144 RepID=I4YED5_WALMC|nr:hypothetical protein WALSEDRAFT_32032 [Wallemia mellicola CBS 633.66]EIM22327.1 hypothetical protein WALSEDRAFT_32032 [Wallemia mellicola CBS 633.66]|eukprot:XP_006957582.1 hypothetical protein WALSEDRAFT_32032 [Wallemia mellicola CBS 633.66]